MIKKTSRIFYVETRGHWACFNIHGKNSNVTTPFIESHVFENNANLPIQFQEKTCDWENFNGFTKNRYERTWVSIDLHL